MRTKDMKSALGSSLKAEQEAIRSRFERAETALARGEAPTPTAEPAPARESAVDETTRVKRDSFTMPVDDYEKIGALQKRCLRSERSVSKSEILRAGLAALSALSDEELSALVAALPRVKTGRRPLNTV